MKRKGGTARDRLKEAWSEIAIRRTGTGYEAATAGRGASPRPGIGKSNVNWNGGRGVVMRCPSDLPSPSTPYGDRSGLQPPRRPTTPSADFCAAVKGPCGSLSPADFPARHGADLPG